MKLGSALSQAPRGVTDPPGLEKHWSEVCRRRQSWGGGVQCGGKVRLACEPNTHGPHGGDGSRGRSWCGRTAARGSCVISREAWVGAALGLGGTSAPPLGVSPQFRHLQGQVPSPPPRAVLRARPVIVSGRLTEAPPRLRICREQRRAAFAGGVLNRIPVSRTTREAELRVNYYPAIEKYEIASFAATWTDLAAVIRSEVSQTETSTM